MSDFEVGQRVRIVSSTAGDFCGMVGTVIHVGNHGQVPWPYTVAIPQEITTCWSARELEVVESEP